MTIEQFADLGVLPHCDQAVLHAPSECQYCDRHPDWQALRDLWGIAFTGHAPTEHQMPCPSDNRRGTGKAHVWGGNRPTDVDAPQEDWVPSGLVYGPVSYSGQHRA